MIKLVCFLNLERQKRIDLIKKRVNLIDNIWIFVDDHYSLG